MQKIVEGKSFQNRKKAFLQLKMPVVSLIGSSLSTGICDVSVEQTEMRATFVLVWMHKKRS